ncbi:MAG: FGGY family carbohydrate kinase [Bacteroidota bacterium]|nr:FGGY family carbohydrate kinase [Bacteroidota bacterium]
MSAIPVIAVFDVGKTNKKLFLFDQQYRIVFERTARFIETTDEDGDPCENVDSLRLSVFDSLREVFQCRKYNVKAINFSTYGASFVYLDREGRVAAPLYNYLKAYPEQLKSQFYAQYGGETAFSFRTASPVLGSLNSGMQLYRIKYEKPELYNQIYKALHLPQYMSYLLSGEYYSDITSIGCHTALWDFQKGTYHEWVGAEGIDPKLAPIVSCQHVSPASFPGNGYVVGVGLHDSSAALIPYLLNFHEPFVLLSTGTWCITLNPFNNSPLTEEELRLDSLCYLTFQGKPVKASRLFAGHEHEQQVRRIAEHFQRSAAEYRTLCYQPELVAGLIDSNAFHEGLTWQKESPFAQRDLTNFTSYEQAYHQLILDLVRQQYVSSQLVMKGTNIKRMFVDGGFSKNAIYMHLLAALFPEVEVYAASVAQATALGTALCIHQAWNERPIPTNLIELKYYSTLNDRLINERLKKSAV